MWALEFAALQTMADEEFPHGRRYYTKSGYCKTLDDSTIDLMVQSLSSIPSPMTQIELAYLGGAAGSTLLNKDVCDREATWFLANAVLAASSITAAILAGSCNMLMLQVSTVVVNAPILFAANSSIAGGSVRSLVEITAHDDGFRHAIVATADGNVTESDGICRFAMSSDFSQRIVEEKKNPAYYMPHNWVSDLEN
jgi:hypothetical protein